MIGGVFVAIRRQSVKIHDEQARINAVRPEKSFIVQAPAGSGKTTLLINRLINCLLTVNDPKHVLALTFTNKAADEINHRLKATIHLSEEDLQDHPNKEKISQLKTHIASLNWAITDDGVFNRCKTYDAFILELADLTEKITIFPRYIYELTVDNVLYGDDYNAFASSLGVIKQYIQNNHEKLRELLIYLLESREQWLNTLLQKHFDADQAYRLYLRHLIAYCHEHFSNSFSICAYLFQYHPNANGDFDTEKLSHWRMIAELFLTKTGQWRTRLTKDQGFTAEQRDLKKAVLEQLSQLPEHLAEFIFDIQALPEHLSEKSLQMSNAMFELLPKLCAALNLTIQDTQLCDYTHVTLQCLEKLQEDHLIGMRCDQIHHLLVDEYQDTSSIQDLFIKNMIQHWNFSQQKSLFIVGDPMQSIYRFRQADVRSFIRAQTEGIGPFKFENLYLTTNFRSSSTVIDHVNQLFPHIMPKKVDLIHGAIPYSLCNAAKHDDGFVQWIDTDSYVCINDWIRGLDGTVAILGRSRSQLHHVIQNLEIPYQDVGLKKLIEMPIIQDLVSLTLEIYSPDALSTIAVASMPYFEMSWIDIENQTFSISYQQFQSILNAMRENQLHASPSELIINLANEILPNWNQYDACYEFITCINQLHLDHIPLSRLNITTFFSSKYASSQNTSSKTFILTIHQAKGLEFDYVIIPDIHKSTVTHKDQLLYCHKYNLEAPEIIGNIHDPDLKLDGLNRLIRKEVKKSYDFELQRLFYVAVTRAKKGLIYVGSQSHNANTFSQYLSQIQFPISPKVTNINAQKAKASIQQSTQLKPHPRQSVLSCRFSQSKVSEQIKTLKSILNAKLQNNDEVTEDHSLYSNIMTLFSKNIIQLMIKTPIINIQFDHIPKYISDDLMIVDYTFQHHEEKHWLFIVDEQSQVSNIRKRLKKHNSQLSHDVKIWFIVINDCEVISWNIDDKEELLC